MKIANELGPYYSVWLSDANGSITTRHSDDSPLGRVAFHNVAYLVCFSRFNAHKEDNCSPETSRTPMVTLLFIGSVVIIEAGGNFVYIP